MNYMQRAWQNFQGAGANAQQLMQDRLREETLPQFMGIMGMNYLPDQQGPDGLISGAAGTPGGLMAGDLEDPRTWLTAGMGLMALPGYQQMGSRMVQDVMAQQLGLAQQRFENQLAMREAEQAKAQMVGFGGEAYKDMAQYQSTAGGLRDDATAQLAPFRQQMSLYNTVQNVVGDKGFHKMGTADDELLIKSYAKMLLPTEGVMTDDTTRIAASDKLPSVLRGLAAKFNAKLALEPEERQEIYDSMSQIAASASPRYAQVRQDFNDRAIRGYINPADVLNTQIEMDRQQFGLDYLRPQVVQGQRGEQVPANSEPPPNEAFD